MNKQSVNKLTLFLKGIEQRIEDNSDYFKKVTAVYKSGTKKYSAIAVSEGSGLKFSYAGSTQQISTNRLSEKIAAEAPNFESLTVTYEERGGNLIIEADDRNVRMRNVSPDNTENIKPHAETSQIGNRNYLIKVGQADQLLRAIGILAENGKVKNDMIRKYNQIDHFVELIDDMVRQLCEKHESITILDCGCGKSYLTFVLNYYIREVLKKPCYFIGLDNTKAVIEASGRIADSLGYTNMEFRATDIRNYNADREIHLVISLHACDTATDQAIALAVRNNVKAMVMVPCCHRELLNQYSYEPFAGILKHGVFKARIADTLTDGLRAMLLEALGYRVSVVEYISPLETPKNLMMRAEKEGSWNKRAMEDYKALRKLLNAELTVEKLLGI